MHVYDTLSAAVDGLKERGFTLDFNLAENCIVCNDKRFSHEQFEIVEAYRFEGDSDPADEAVVYGIQSNEGHMGILVNGYGPSADAMSSDLSKKLQFHQN